MKKYISVFVCLCLLIVSLFLLPEASDSSKHIAGAGENENEKIESVADVKQLLDAFSNFDSASLSNDAGDNVFLLSNTNDTLPPISKEEKKYNSFSVCETAAMTSVTDYLLFSVTTTLDRTLSIYITPDATYYHSVGELSTIGKNLSDPNWRNHCSFDVEVYIDHTNGDSLMKVNRFDMIAKKKVTFSEEAIGKWLSVIDMTALSVIDEINRNLFSQLSNVVDFALQEDLYDHSRAEYVLKDKAFWEALGAEIHSTFGECRIDLSDAEAPVFSLGYNIAANHLDVEYVFKNINNTVVHFPSNVEILEINDENAERYIIMENMGV